MICYCKNLDKLMCEGNKIEGLKCKWKIGLKEDKAKHGLMIRAKYHIFGLRVLGFTMKEKRRSLALVQSIVLVQVRRKEENEARTRLQEIQVWTYLAMFGLGNFPTSFFVYM